MVSGEGQFSPPTGPAVLVLCCPVSCSLLPVTCTTCVFAWRPARPVFVASYSCVMHNTPKAGRAIIQLSLSLSPILSVSLAFPPPCV